MQLPLAFVWKTSRGDQTHTDTILVRPSSYFYADDLGKPEMVLSGAW